MNDEMVKIVIKQGHVIMDRVNLEKQVSCQDNALA
jgi:hypothetical protein